MNSYATFAQFYDTLTDNVEYNKRADYICQIMRKFGNSGKDLLDLACGTATLSLILSNMGYNVTGLDLSEDMLTIAQQKSNGDINLIKGDMTDFVLPINLDYCICSLDAINHLNDINSVIDCFNSVYNNLAVGGLFIFDVNTVYKHKEILADNAFVFDEDDFFLSWDNELDGNTVNIMLDFFVYNGKNYDRFSESFDETAYPIQQLVNALNQVGFNVLALFDDLTFNKPTETSQRVYFVCKRMDS